jgi:large subunit ribosomal protein L54
MTPKGTVMTGLNILANGQDPVALADEEYPPWLWKLTEPKKKRFAPEEQFSKAYFKVERKRKQLAWNKARAKAA